MRPPVAARADATPVTITSVLRTPNVARTLGSSVLARLPYGAMTLLIVLRLTESGHAYGEAGIAAAAYAIAVAVASPLLSRVVDRQGQTKLLLVTAVTGSLATATIAIVPGGSPLGLFIVLSAVNGALQPPLGGVMRALWDVLLTRDEERHVGYAVEAGAVELVFTGGPLLIVGGVAGAFGAAVGLFVAAALTGLGTLAFAMSEPSRRWQPSPDRKADFVGAVRSPGVRTLMVVSAGAGGSFGAVEIGVTAFSRLEGATALIGVLLAIWSIGSLFGGLLIARLRPAPDPARRIVLCLLLMAVGNGILGIAGHPVLLGALLFVAGGAIAPTFATSNAVMGSVAPAGTITEAFAFTLGAVMIGLTISSPAAGFLVDHVSTGAALSFAGAAPALAAVIVWLRRGTLDIGRAGGATPQPGAAGPGSEGPSGAGPTAAVRPSAP